jgi:hypothetical protein
MTATNCYFTDLAYSQAGAPSMKASHNILVRSHSDERTELTFAIETDTLFDHLIARNINH